MFVMPRVVIDRPKGTKKVFATSRGPREMIYPLDYGYLEGVINPDDNEDADVFVGTSGPHCGRFMKGKPGPTGMVPDERKWFAGLTDTEYQTLRTWWQQEHEPGLTWGWTTLADIAAVVADARNGMKES